MLGVYKQSRACLLHTLEKLIKNSFCSQKIQSSRFSMHDALPNWRNCFHNLSCLDALPHKIWSIFEQRTLGHFLLELHPNSLVVTPNVHPINLRHMGTTQVQMPKLAQILKTYLECDTREGDNKGSGCRIKAVECIPGTIIFY